MDPVGVSLIVKRNQSLYTLRAGAVERLRKISLVETLLEGLYRSKGVENLLGFLEALVGILLQAAHDDLLQGGRDLRAEITQLSRRSMDVMIEHFSLDEWRLARQEVENRASKGIDVRPEIDRLTEYLLRRHI